MTESKTFVLPDKRRLGFTEYGAPNGMPIVYGHSSPGSRFQISATMAQTAARLGIRLIVPERPGYGLSDPLPGRTLHDWPRDVATLMDSLDVARFGMIGFSMGGPYSLACGHALPRRVTGIALVGSTASNVFEPEVKTRMSPPVAEMSRLARDDPSTLRQMLESFSQAPDHLLAALVESLSLPDKTVVAIPDVKAGFLLDCKESLCHSSDGMVTDFALSGSDWGFRLEEIDIPVHLWHGEEDINTPLPMAHYLLSKLPNGQGHLLRGEGHLCLFSHWENILRTLIDV